MEVNQTTCTKTLVVLKQEKAPPEAGLVSKKSRRQQNEEAEEEEELKTIKRNLWTREERLAAVMRQLQTIDHDPLDHLFSARIPVLSQLFPGHVGSRPIRNSTGVWKGK